MDKIRLNIKLSDNEYVKHLSEYIRINGLNIISLTEENPDITLIDSQQNNDEFILKTHTKETHMYRYKCADRIIGSIIENVDISLGVKGKSNNRTIFVTSAHGGAGKTYISQALSIYLSRNGRKVLYVNLDGLCVKDSIFKCDEQNDISLINYYAKKGNENINAYIERYKNYDAAKNVFFLKSIYPSYDVCFDMNSAKVFIDSLNSNDLYNYTIIDCPLYPFSQYALIMKNSYKTLLIKNRGSEREEEAAVFLKKNDIKIMLICNMIRYTEGIYVPKAEEDISHNPKTFYESIEQIVYELEKSDDAGL